MKNKEPKQDKRDVPSAPTGPAAAEMEALVGLFNAGRLDAAEKEASRLIALHDKVPVLHNILGSALLGQGKRDEAVTAFERTLSIDPGNAQACNNLGNAYAMAGRFEEATQYYRRALERNPEFFQAHNNLGNALRELGRFDEAVASFERAIAVDPNIAQTHVNLGTAQAAQGRFAEAEGSFRRALALRPDFAQAHNNLGNALKHLGRLEEAMASFRQALALKADSADAYYNLHPLLLEQEGPSPAIECMRRAVELEPQNLGYQLFLGMLLEYSGDAAGAAPHLQAVGQGRPLDRARLDAWNYIKSVGPPAPRMIGSHREAFRLGLAAARDAGLVLEFGVRFGSSIRQIAGLTGQPVHGFDSFEGLPEAWHHEQKGSYSTGGAIPKVPGHVTLHKGWFEDTLPDFVKTHTDPVRFMNVDCDLYSATRTILGTLAPQIVSGTVIVFDEYVGNEHWRDDEFKAFQEAVGTYGWRYEYLAFSLFTKQTVVRIL